MSKETIATVPHRCPTCGARVHVRRAERRFSILDAMILVAASAVAFVIVRTIMGGNYPAGLHWTRWLFSFLVGGMVAWSPAVLWIALRHPRPNLRRLTRQPGFVASVAATVLIALALLMIGVFGLVRLGSSISLTPGPGPVGVPAQDSDWWVQIVFYHAGLIGAVVLAAWIILAISGRRRPTRRWIDNLGRLIGSIWIVLFLIRMVTSLWYLRH